LEKKSKSENNTEDQKETFEQIKNLLYTFTFRAKNTEELESLEEVMKAAKKTAEGLRDMKNITFPDLVTKKKIELVITSIEVDLNQDKMPKGDIQRKKLEENEKQDKIVDTSTDISHKSTGKIIETVDQNIIPEIVKKIRKTPLITTIQKESVIFGEPMTRQPKMSFLISFIVDDITFALWGECKSCSDCGKSCIKCKKRGGIRAIISGFTFVPKPIEFTVWGSQLLGLFGLEKSGFVNLIKSHEDYARKEFLKLYRARLFVVQSKYTEYNGQLKISANKLNCVSWNSLLIDKQI